MALTGLFDLLLVQEEALGVLLEAGQNEVGTNGLHQNQTLALTVLSQECNTILDRLLGSLILDFLAMDEDLAAVQRISAENRTHSLSTACAYQTGKAEDLAAVSIKADVMQNAALFQILNGQNGLGALGAKFLGELVLESTAYHSRDQRIIVPILGVAGLDILAVTDDRNAVAKLEELLELVGYVNNTYATSLELTASSHQLSNFLLTEGGGGLIHDDHLRIDQNCLCNLDHLLYTHTEVACGLGRINVLAEGSHNFLSLLVHGIIVEQSALLDPLVNENVVSDAQKLLHVQLLINAGNTCSGGFVRILKDLLFAVYIDFALISLVYTSEDLDQRGLTRAVLTDQTEDLTRLDRELHVLQCDNARKSLCRIS